MKRTLLALACLSALSLAAFAADDEKAKPDNTATNERDRSGETQTSGDQSNSSADLKITQAIRQALMKARELSTTAKNIKVITANGQVTLRGPVKTAQEKAKNRSACKISGCRRPDRRSTRSQRIKVTNHLKQTKEVIMSKSVAPPVAAPVKGNYLIAVHTDENQDVDRAKHIFKTAGAEDISTVSEASAPTLNE